MGATTIRAYQVGKYAVKSILTEKTWKQNCYLVTDTESGCQAMVDPGDIPEILIEQVESSGSGTLEHIFLTHAHHDHISALDALGNKFNMTGVIHRDDTRLLRQATMYAMRFANKVVTAPECYEVFDGEPEFKLGDDVVRVFHTPGHTKGGVCFYFPGFVCTGDTLLFQRVGRTDLPGGCVDLISRSIEMLLCSLPDQTVIFPGHGKPWTIGEAKSWWQIVEAAPPKYDSFTHL